MDRRAAGALLALAACFASAAAAPTAGNQTALDLYDGKSEGCYYNFQHYGEGDRIMTNEPCLNCTCHNRMLMCYLRVCPFTKPIGQDCSVEKRADQCCPIVTCPDVPVDLLTLTSTSSPAEYGETGVGKLERYGCSINGKYFSEGSKVPATPNKPCEHCYCIRNMTTCVMQECTLHVDGCTPIYHKDVCCPVRYSCDHPEDEIPLLDDMTTTVRPTPGFLLTTTTLAPVTQMTQDCVHDDKVFADGALIKTEKACQHCYCMKGDIVCVVQECGTPMENEGKNCTSMPPREGQCCPDTYICESDEVTTETGFTTISTADQVTTLSPPRRVNVEGSGYRNEPDEPFTELPTIEPDTEGSGEEKFEPNDAGEMPIPEKETTPSSITNDQDEDVDILRPTTDKIPVMDVDIPEKATTEPEKGENIVPSGGMIHHSTDASIRDYTLEDDTPTVKPVPTTESYFEEKTTAVREDGSSVPTTTATEADALPTKPTIITETTVTDHQSPSLVDKSVTADNEPVEITELTPSKQEDEEQISENTTLKELEELTTKASEFTVLDILTTESSTAFVEQAAKSTTAQLPEEENEVIIKEPITSTKPDVVRTETEPSSSKQPEIVTEPSTSSENLLDTTPINPVDNEIDEEPFPTPSPGRIPGEGDCLLDGVTYSNESNVPSSNNCHSSCRCISSIVKCDPIICSAPPDYMDNCQPMYDTPESCCPTYVCDHTKETVPPQSHSQMSGTESPVQTPTIECHEDQCVVKDKGESIKPAEPCTSEGCSDDSSKKSEDCGTEDCQGTGEKTDFKPHPSGSTEECIGDKCTSPQENCAEGNCEIPITKDQNCDSENGCEIPVQQPCQGVDCKIQPEISPAKDGPTLCNDSDGCKDSKVPESTPDCEGESCHGLPAPVVPDDTEKCKDGSDCYQPAQTDSTPEECNEESCVQKPVSDIGKPVTGECTDSQCKSQDSIPQTTETSELDSEHIPKVTETPASYDTKPDDTVSDVPEAANKEELGKTTLPVVEELESTTEYVEKDGQRKEETGSSVTMVPELDTETPKEEHYDSHTDITIEKETTIIPLVDTTVHDDYEATSKAVEEHSTHGPKLSQNDDEGPITAITETRLPETVTQSTDRFDAVVTTLHTDTIRGEEKYDITTALPSGHVDHNASTETVTEYQDKQSSSPIYTDTNEESLTTQSSHLEPQQGESQTESSGMEDSHEKTKEPVPNVTEPTEAVTTDKGQKSTEQSVNREEEPATSKYDSERTSEEILDTITNAPETTISPIVKEATTTNKPQDIIPVFESTNAEPEELVTKPPVSDITDTTSKPEADISSQAPEVNTQLPELHATELQETTPKMSDIPQEIEDHSVITPPVNFEPNEYATEVPMSTAQDQDNVNPTEISPIGVDDMDQEKNTRVSESPIPHSTESYPPEPEHSSSAKPETEEMDKDIETMPNLSDIEHTDVTTEKPDFNKETTSQVLINETSTVSTVKESEDSETPASEPITEETPISVSISAESSSLGYNEPSVTEPTIQETGAPHKDNNEIIPELVTEISTQTISEVVDIVTPTRDEFGETKDEVTEIPELTIHEHTDATYTTIGSKDTEKVTEASDTFATVSQENIGDKEVIKTTEPQDSAIPEVPVKETQEEEHITTAPDQQTKINELKPHDITEQSSTETQKVPTEAPENQDAPNNIPDKSITEKEKDLTVPSTLDDITTSIPKIAVTEPTKEETSFPDLQGTIAPDIYLTETVQATETPERQDIPTKLPEISIEQTHKESTEAPEPHYITTNAPEIIESDLHKDSFEPPATTDASISDVTAVELDRDVITTPGMKDLDTKIHQQPEMETKLQKETSEYPQGTTIKVPEILVTLTQEEVTEIPASHNTVPYATSAEPQQEASEVPQKQEIATDISEPQKETANIPVEQEVVTNIPETHVTEKSTEPHREVTDTPVLQNEESNISVIPVSVTESQMETTEVPVSQDVETQKEIPEKPELHNTATYIPGIPTMETQMAVTESLEPQDNANVPHVLGTESPIDVTAELEHDKEPSNEDTEVPVMFTEKDVTESPEAQVTNIPKISETEQPQKEADEPQKEVEKPQQEAEKPLKEAVEPEAPEMVVTDANIVTEVTKSESITTSASGLPATEEHQEVTKSSESPEFTTIATEISESEPHKTVTEEFIQESVTTSVEEIQTKTDEPLKITTKLDEHTESELSESDMQTESPKIEQSSLPTEGELSQDQSTKVPESLLTELEHKTTDSDSATTIPTPSKTDEEQTKDDENIVTGSPIAEPTMKPEHVTTQKHDIITELPISQIPVEFDTKSPHFDDTERVVTITPEVHPTEKEEDVTETPEVTRRTDATSQFVDQEDNVTKSPKEPGQTSETKHEIPETTPYLVLLEEHTHKNNVNAMSPEDEITTVSTELPSDHELSTPEYPTDKITESVPITEIQSITEKPSEQEAMPTDEGQSIQDSEKITDHTVVSDKTTTIASPPEQEDSEMQVTEKPIEVESNEISTSSPTLTEEQSEREKPVTPAPTSQVDQDMLTATEKQSETSTPEEEFILATTKATTIKTEQGTTPSSFVDKFNKPEEESKPETEGEKPKPDTTIEEIPKPVTNEIQPTEEVPQPDDESHFPPSGTSSYGQEPDYGEEDQAFGPGTCRYGGKVYVSAQQIPRDDPCDFCFCFRSDIICLQQSCPPPIHGCHEEPIQGFCCPRYECPVSMATSVNVTTTTTTTTTTLPPHFLPHAYPGMVQRRGCQIKGHTYKVGEVVRASSGPCLHCTCGGDGQMKCDPKVCTPEPMLRQMIAAAVSAKRRR